jgi:hypothetical protein
MVTTANGPWEPFDGDIPGAVFLKERLDEGRLAGSSLILIGLALIALSP